MRRYNLFYFIGQALSGLFRNGVMSFASVAVLMSCLVVTGGFSLLVLNIDANLEQIGLLKEIVVFCPAMATEEEVAAVGEQISKLDNIEKVERVTKEQALAGMYFSADADFEDPRCRSCPVKHTCYTCLGTNYLYRGDVRKRDPLHCRLYQAEIRATAHMWIGKLRAKDAYTETEKKMIKTVRKLMEAFQSGTIGMRDM